MRGEEEDVFERSERGNRKNYVEGNCTTWTKHIKIWKVLVTVVSFIPS